MGILSLWVPLGTPVFPLVCTHWVLLGNKLDQERRRLEKEIEKADALILEAALKKSHLQKVLIRLGEKEDKMASSELASIEEVEALVAQSSNPPPTSPSTSAIGGADVASFDWSLVSPEVLAELGFGGGTPQPS